MAEATMDIRRHEFDVPLSQIECSQACIILTLKVVRSVKL